MGKGNLFFWSLMSVFILMFLFYIVVLIIGCLLSSKGGNTLCIRHCLHPLWMCFGLLSFIVLTLSMIFFPASVLLMDSCQVMSTFVTNETYFNDIAGESLQDWGDTVSTCIYGDGKWTDKLPIKD